MLKPKRIIQILSGLALITLLWMVFLLIQGLFERKISHHELYIPKNAESVLEINGEKLIRMVVEDVLAKRQLDDKLDGFINSSESSESLGMDYLSTYYVFTVEEESKLLTGILVNILDEDQFAIAMGTNSESGTGFAVSNGVGLMLFDSGNNLMSTDKLNSIASKIVKRESGYDFSKFPISKKTYTARYWQKDYSFNQGAKTFSNISLALSTEGNEIKMTGTANFESSVNRSYPVLTKSDLSVQTQFIPDFVNQFWVSNMKNNGVSFPKLTYISGNYHYSEPSPIKELKVLPNFDGVYSFEKNFQVRIPLIALSASGKINSLNLKSFNIGDKLIYYKQIDKKTIYLGQSRYNPAANQENALLEVTGDLKQLLEIRNGGIITQFLALSPEYIAADRFLSGIEHSNFHIKDQDNQTVDVFAEMSFEKDENALNQVILLLIDLGVFD